MVLVIGLIFALAATATLVYLRTRQRHPRNGLFPPVVELAHTAPLPRIGFKIATLSAREPTHRQAATQEPAAAGPPEGPSFVDAAPAQTPSPVASGMSPSVYETHTGPYTANVVQGARITLPDDGEADLPIRFRSDHPSARPIAVGGEVAEQVQVTDTDGRIRVGFDTSVVFSGPTD